MRWSLLGMMVGLSAWAAAPARPQGRLGNHREDDPVVARVDPAVAEANEALLRGVLFALEPAPTEIRVIAIEDLGLLGDARALNPLAQLLMDPNPLVSNAALRAIGLIRHPRAEEILTNIARHPTLPERLKLTAINLVLFQNTPSAVGFLQFAARATHFTANVQNEARKVLADIPSERLGASR